MIFLSIPADGSTDSGNIEDKLYYYYLVVYCDPYTKDGKVHVRNKFLTVRRPTSSTRALTYAGIPDWQNNLVGFGSDGSSHLKGYLKKSVPWVLVFLLVYSH